MPLVVPLHALGATGGVHVTGDASELLATSLHHAWRRCVGSPEVGTGVSAATVNAHLDHPEELRAVMDRLTTEVTRGFIAANVGRLLMFHGAALADPDTGRSVILVAPSGTGKTTAAIALGASLGYVTDETAAVDEHGWVLPYPKPLSLLTPTGRPKDQVSPDDLGLLPAPADCALAAVVVLERHRGWEGPPSWAQVDTLTALTDLAEHISSLSSLPHPLSRLASTLAGVGGLRRVRYGEASALRPGLRELLA